MTCHDKGDYSMLFTYVLIHKNRSWGIDCINTVSGGELESISFASDAD